jgi:rare lipoprotein A
VLLAMLLVNGCVHTNHKDGPPDFDVDESRIPNASPKVEPLSRSGNMNSYKVFGQRYYVLKSSRNYQERGVASWYGTQFHTHHTSNGERYNMLAMTAAHKTLPLPTYVQVTNLRNGKQVIVKVNDRGPFESNRLIDLSYVAAKKLGMLGHGTTMVDVKSVDPRDNKFDPALLVKKKSAATYADAYYPNGHPRHVASVAKQRTTYASTKKPVRPVVDKSLYLQVGAFHTKTSAERVKRKLDAMLTKTPVSIHTSENMFRVKVGPFKDMASANRISKRLQSVGLHDHHVTEEIDISETL